MQSPLFPGWLGGEAVIAKRKVKMYSYYTAIKKNEIMPFAATWMDLEILTLSEVSQTEEDKYHMISLIRGI